MCGSKVVSWFDQLLHSVNTLANATLLQGNEGKQKAKVFNHFRSLLSLCTWVNLHILTIVEQSQE